MEIESNRIVDITVCEARGARVVILVLSNSEIIGFLLCMTQNALKVQHFEEDCGILDVGIRSKTRKYHQIELQPRNKTTVVMNTNLYIPLEFTF